MEKLDCLLLVGGLGTRLKSVIGELPKALAPINGRPFIDYLISYLSKSGMNQIILCTGYESEKIIEYCGSGKKWGIEIIYSQENKPLGTGGAIENAKFAINSKNFLVINGDTFVDVRLTSLINYHITKRAIASITLAQISDQSRYGSVLLTKNGNIEEFVEKGKHGPGLINAGFYIFQESIFKYFPNQIGRAHV